MKYDPLKHKLESILEKSTLARKLFFAAMDRLFLRARYILRELKKLQRSGFSPEEILDAGSGFGQYSFHLARIFPKAKITGMDLKADLVAAANQTARKIGLENLSFLVGDLLEMNFKEQFDLVLNVDVLEHIKDDQLAIANIGKALKKGGLFVLTTPFYDGTLQAKSSFVEEHVRCGYSRAELQEKLAKGGLQLNDFRITYGFWGNIAWQLLQKVPLNLLSGRIWVAPLVFLHFIFAYPIAWVCMQLDMFSNNKKGGGILAVAVKTELHKADRD